MADAFSMIKTLQDLADKKRKSDPYQRAMEDTYLKEKVLPVLSAQYEAKSYLDQLNNLYEQNPNATSGLGGLNTGPLAGTYWEALPNFGANAQPQYNHPVFKTIADYLAGPEDAKVRANFNVILNKLGQTDFDTAGKALTGIEASKMEAGRPSMFLEPEVNKELINNSKNKFIPQVLVKARNMIIGRGFEPEVADEIINRFMNEYGRQDQQENILKSLEQPVPFR